MNRSVSVDEALRLAAEKLGYRDLKPEQGEVVKAFVEGSDVFAALPTGCGKSLCFAILPLVYDILRGHTTPTSIVVCVSPLVALMMDQKSKFSPRGLVTEFVGGCSHDTEASKSVYSGNCQLVYMTPEALFTSSVWWEMFRTKVYQHNFVAVVVNEAHCVPKWYVHVHPFCFSVGLLVLLKPFRGLTFRKAFERIGEVRSVIPKHVHLMALTATAAKDTRRSILQKLNMADTKIINISPEKGNIFWYVISRQLKSLLIRWQLCLLVKDNMHQSCLYFAENMMIVIDFTAVLKLHLVKVSQFLPMPPTCHSSGSLTCTHAALRQLSKSTLSVNLSKKKGN